MLIGEGETEGDQGAHEMRTLEKSGRRGGVFIAPILPHPQCVEMIVTQGSGWAIERKKPFSLTTWLDGWNWRWPRPSEQFVMA